MTLAGEPGLPFGPQAFQPGDDLGMEPRRDSSFPMDRLLRLTRNAPGITVPGDRSVVSLHVEEELPVALTHGPAIADLPVQDVVR